MPKFISNSKLSKKFSDRVRERETNDWEFNAEYVLLQLSEEISKQLQRMNINQADLARLLGTSRAHVTQVLKGKPNLRLKTLFKLCHVIGLGIKMEFLPLEIRDFKPDIASTSNETILMHKKEFVESKVDDYVPTQS